MKSTSGKMLSFQQHTFTWDVNFLVEVAAAAADIMCFVELFSLLKRARVCVCSRSVNMQFHFEHFSYSMCVLANAIIAFSLLLFSLMSFEKKSRRKNHQNNFAHIDWEASSLLCLSSWSLSLAPRVWMSWCCCCSYNNLSKLFARAHTFWQTWTTEIQDHL